MAYSINIKLWGSELKRNKNIANEVTQLNLLKRGVYLKKDVIKNEQIKFRDLYFAFPCSDGQMKANNLSKNLKIFSKSNIKKDSPLKFSKIKVIDKYSKVLKIRDRIQNF